MRDLHFGRVIDVHVDEIVFHDCRVAAFAKAQPDQPDLDDPATLGCLLALVREAWGSPHIGLLWFEADDGLHVCSVTRERADLWESVRIVAEASTEAAALVAALEAAP